METWKSLSHVHSSSKVADLDAGYKLNRRNEVVRFKSFYFGGNYERNKVAWKSFIFNSVLNKYPFKSLMHHVHTVNGEKHGCTAFYVNQLTGKHVYVNTDFIPDCYGSVLVRKCADTKDYIGGDNNWVKTREDLWNTAIKVSGSSINDYPYSKRVK
jgi:hypothetical protein